MKPLVRLAALIAIALIAGINLGETLRPLLPLWNGAADFVSPSEERFRALRAEAPSSGEVGYATDRSSTDVLSDPEAVKNYYLTQYALTPLVVNSTSPNQSVVIGNFSGTVKTVLPKGGAVHDFGGGLVIVKRQAK